LVEATTSLLNLFLDVIETPGQRGHLGLFFDDDWHRQDQIISYGHDIEASWLLLETAQVLGDEQLLQKALAHTEQIAIAALEGKCIDGSMVYERHENGTYNNDKHWWVQAETVIGQLYLYRFHGHEEMLERSYQTWQYILNNIVDNEGGEWHWSRKNGEINRVDDKAGFWKCPYHNSRMCLEVIERLSE
jgi:mannobiose 2-epimerase